MRKIANVNRSVCVACGVCRKSCPKGAMEIWRGCYAQADPVSCVGCGLCAKNCPTDCIRIQERGEGK